MNSHEVMVQGMSEESLTGAIAQLSRNPLTYRDGTWEEARLSELAAEKKRREETPGENPPRKGGRVSRSHYSRRAERAFEWAALFLGAVFVTAPWIYIHFVSDRPLPAVICGMATLGFLIGCAERCREGSRCLRLHFYLYHVPTRK